jgi:hypothetical protein
MTILIKFIYKFTVRTFIETLIWIIARILSGQTFHPMIILQIEDLLTGNSKQYSLEDLVVLFHTPPVEIPMKLIILKKL